MILSLVIFKSGLINTDFTFSSVEKETILGISNIVIIFWQSSNTSGIFLPFKHNHANYFKGYSYYIHSFSLPWDAQLQISISLDAVRILRKLFNLVKADMKQFFKHYCFHSCLKSKIVYKATFTPPLKTLKTK